MVGLNVEMARELLWRDFPLDDERATFFSRFWQGTQPGRRHRAPRRLGQPSAGRQRAARCGGRTVGAAGAQHAVPPLPRRAGLCDAGVARDARAQAGHRGSDLQPLFRGSLQPDVTFFGFALDPDDAAADPGWYFVIQQQPTEPRFGFDVDIDFAGARHVPLAAPPAGLALPANTRWAHNAAHMAQIARQQPVRVAIHASELLSGLR